MAAPVSPESPMSSCAGGKVEVQAQRAVCFHAATSGRLGPGVELSAGVPTPAPTPSTVRGIAAEIQHRRRLASHKEDLGRWWRVVLAGSRKRPGAGARSSMRVTRASKADSNEPGSKALVGKEGERRMVRNGQAGRSEARLVRGVDCHERGDLRGRPVDFPNP